MEAEYYIDLEKQTGRFRLELIEMLERYCFYAIEKNTAFLMVNRNHLDKIRLDFFPQVETVITDLLTGCDSIIIGFLNFKKTHELLLPFIEKKIYVDNIISFYEENYINYVNNFRRNKNEWKN